MWRYQQVFRLSLAGLNTCRLGYCPGKYVSCESAHCLNLRAGKEHERSSYCLIHSTDGKGRFRDATRFVQATSQVMAKLEEESSSHSLTKLSLLEDGGTWVLVQGQAGHLSGNQFCHLETDRGNLSVVPHTAFHQGDSGGSWKRRGWLGGCSRPLPCFSQRNSLIHWPPMKWLV